MVKRFLGEIVGEVPEVILEEFPGETVKDIFGKILEKQKSGEVPEELRGEIPEQTQTNSWRIF